ncbi:MAG: DUF4232 domain-containing protein [Pseudolysinimonas sp.]|uniref:DUF4232 domain-containing protein n=1 Tax=Pseudolysinimonas sp. TaxID=2680009 RepID=UPI003267CA64
MPQIPHRFPVRRALPVVGALIVVAALAACVPGAGAGVPSSSPSGAASASASPSPSGAASGAPVAGAPCTRDSLIATYTATDGTAGHLHGILTFQNHLDTPCTLSGYPTVYFGQPDTAGGMGAPASNDSSDPGSPVTLGLNDTAVANLTITEAGIVDGCAIVDTYYFAVSPPGVGFDIDTNAMQATAEGLEGCSNDVSLLVVGGIAAE